MATTTAASSANRNYDGGYIHADGEWLNAGNIYASDNAYATAISNSNTNYTTHFLFLSGFDFSAIPSGDVVTGVALEIEGKADVSLESAYITSELTRDATSNGSDEFGGESGGFGTISSSRPIVVTTSDGTNTVNLWPSQNAQWPTRAELLDSDFGVKLQLTSGYGTDATFSIDRVRLTITHEAGPPTEEQVAAAVWAYASRTLT